ncbi:hypothetical protein KIPB_001056 [Kipferlia bialata]|uniref:Uncharacterized protein n=1 Tax=Kipferlia bialata TaxID=797122 RepID=A0A9K3CPI8_9EUKA|nr:hypothetical protein KIPB_001056 [Kipferlia bialata]|eukprot:g1056.t1
MNERQMEVLRRYGDSLGDLNIICEFDDAEIADAIAAEGRQMERMTADYLAGGTCLSREQEVVLYIIVYTSYTEVSMDTLQY